jgi:hypothetical protein
MSAPESGDPAIPGSGIKSKSSSKTSTKHGSSKKKKSKSSKTVAGTDFLPTDRPHPPVLAAMNLAVRPDLEIKSSTGVKLLKTKTVTPHHQTNINDESTLQFIIRSRRDEWIRFNPDCLSLVVYGAYNNPNRNAAAAAGTAAGAERHSLRANEGLPEVYLDPSVMGTSFFYKVDVSINNVAVPTNHCLGELVLHYVRCCRVYNRNPGPVFYKTNHVNFAGRNTLSSSMKAATEAFDYVDWNRATGSRIPVFLDGHFPFDCRNRTLESIDNTKESNMYFPPDTSIEIKFHLYRDKGYAIFNHVTNAVNNFDDNPASYWSNRQAAQWANGYALSFQSAELAYESCELHADGHERSMALFRNGGIASYYYDIPRGQHQTLTEGQSFTENTFQIMAFARLVYILFLPNWATFPMEATRRPLSAFSRYPANCSSLRIGFAGEKNLIVDKFINFGMLGTNSELSKRLLFQYLKSLRAFAGDSEDLFPRYTTEHSLVQGFVFDLKDYMSSNTEHLNIQCEFAGPGVGTSPANTQIVVFSVHPNGKATCRQADNPFSYIWNFTQY